MSNRNFVVTVKESGSGEPWLLFELHEGNGLFEMRFESGTPIEKAQELARTINAQVASVGIFKH